MGRGGARPPSACDLGRGGSALRAWHRATLDPGFDQAIGVNEELLECPGSGLDSPTTWHYTDTPDDVAGKVACGTYNGNPDLVWTNDEELLLVDAQGPDLAELHEWWIEFG